MGMYDSVYATCPKCGTQVEFQSKAGKCEMLRYSMNSVPPEVAESINGSTETCDCGEKICLVLAESIRRVAMLIADK